MCETESARTLPPPAIALASSALFLDFDGTLVGLAPTPDAVVVPPGLPDVLRDLAHATSGAVAIITGRGIADVDRFLAPLTLPAAGLHGLLQRDGEGVLHSAPVDEAALAAIDCHCSAVVAAHEGVGIERKSHAVALHWRLAPAAEAACQRAIEEMVAAHPGFIVQRGKCVAEARTRGADKGEAIQRFMRASPFAGRAPVFIGDDVTDEAGFAAVHTVAEARGVSIKVGEGATAARYRLDDHEAVFRWLCAQLEAARR